MKRFFVVVAALCFALAALTGCTRHGPRCGIDFCVCGAEEAAALREMESDLVTLDNAPEPVDKYTEAPGTAVAVATEEDAPIVDVPETPEAAEEPVIAEKVDEADAEEPEEEGFSAEEMAQKVRAIEESTRNEPQIIQDIIDEGYDEVPAVVSEAPVVNVEILPAEETEVAEAEETVEEVAETVTAEVDIEAIEVVEAPELPAVIEETVAEAPVIEPARGQEEISFLLPPPLTAEPGPAAFAAEVEADRSEATGDLTLEGLDDMELEFFGSISESLLEADS